MLINMAPTKRPQNRCPECSYTWYPRGKNVSLKCPKCGSGNVKKVGSVLAGAAVIAFFMLSGNSNNVAPIKTPIATEISENQLVPSDAQLISETTDVSSASIDDSEKTMEFTESGATVNLDIENKAENINERPQLFKYYVLVKKQDGTLETIDLVAENEDSARQIIHDFRGNPVIVQGPSRVKDWTQ